MMATESGGSPSTILRATVDFPEPVPPATPMTRGFTAGKPAFSGQGANLQRATAQAVAVRLEAGRAQIGGERALGRGGAVELGHFERAPDGGEGLESAREVVAVERRYPAQAARGRLQRQHRAT